MDAFEREENLLQESYERGDISQKEYNAELRELQRDYSCAAEEAAQEAYARELEQW